MTTITTNVRRVAVNSEARRIDVSVQRRAVGITPGGHTAPATAPRTAAATISALRAVSEGADGVRHLDPSSGASVSGLLGVAVTSGDAGATVRVQRSGTIDDSGWAWTPGQLVFAGPNGTLTQVPPTNGWEIVVGHAPSATRLNLTFDEPVHLA